MSERQTSVRRIVDKETFITHYSQFHDEHQSYELTMCGHYLAGHGWHLAWRSPPNDVVTCFLCLGAVDD